MPPCHKCNAVYGLFAYLGLEVPFQSQDWACGQDTLRFCFADYTRTTIDAYRSCQEVETCYDYRSQTQCGADPCAKFSAGGEQFCAWNAPPGYDELGKGVCTPNDPDMERCDLCEEIFGTCNEELCLSLGDCYFDGEPNGFSTPPWQPSCIHRRDMACRYYDTREDCLNANGLNQAYDVDIIYDGQTPVGGTHAVTQWSDDLMNQPGNPQPGFGKCQWDTSRGVCLKNSDDLFLTAQKQDDCVEAGLQENSFFYPACLRDTKPPKTTLLLPVEGRYGLGQFTDVDYYITDNLFSRSMVKTFFCLVPEGMSCYPAHTSVPQAIAELGLADEDEGRYLLYYFSKDPAGNYEPVRHALIDIREIITPTIVSVEVMDG
jgi:hypothetical protein